MAMILDLGQSFVAFEWIHATAEYSNAVLVAVLPYISDVAQRLNLGVPHPVTTDQVVHLSVPPTRTVGAEVGIKGGWVFAFRRGYIDTIQSSHSYSALQDPDEIPQYFGQVKMSRAEAIETARDTIRKLGIPLESVCAEQDPQVGGPRKVGTNTVPHYFIVWPDPRGGTSVEVEINGNARRLERICLFNKSLERAPPKVGVVPASVAGQPRWPTVNPEYVRRLVPILLYAVDDYARKLSLPIPQPLTTNHVAQLSIRDNGGWPHCEVELTNGWRFTYRSSIVNGYDTPDRLFFNNNRPIVVRDFLGKWNLTEAEAIDLVRRTIARLHYRTNLVHMDFDPQAHKPAVPGIPRYEFFWDYIRNDQPESAVWAEVDADKRELKSLYYDDRAYWNHPPPIDVPLSLPPEPETKATPAKAARQSRLTPKPPLRPLTPFLRPR